MSKAYELLNSVSGRDGTEVFQNFGHSKDAYKILDGSIRRFPYFVGYSSYIMQRNLTKTIEEDPMPRNLFNDGL